MSILVLGVIALRSDSKLTLKCISLRTVENIRVFHSRERKYVYADASLASFGRDMSTCTSLPPDEAIAPSYYHRRSLTQFTLTDRESTLIQIVVGCQHNHLVSWLDKRLNRGVEGV